MVYFGELKGSPVLDSEGKLVGSLSDLVFVDGVKFAEITHLICCGEDRYKKKINFGLTGKMACCPEAGGKLSVCLTVPEDEITPLVLKKTDMLVSDVLDRQVVDVSGAKIVRVNDILLGKAEGKFSIVAVAVGNVSLLRRLGLSSVAQRFPSVVHEHVIPWESVEPLDPTLHGLHLKVQKSKVADLHPEDIADVMEDLSKKERELIFKNLDRKKAVATLIDAEPRVSQSVLGDMKAETIKDLLEDIRLDHAADIIGMMKKPKAEEILSSMRPEIAAKIRSLLKYPIESAAAIMKTSFITTKEDQTAQQTIELLREKAPSSESVYHLYVVDDSNHLMGVLPIRRLVIAPANKKVSELMKRDPLYVKLSTPKRDIATILTKYDLFMLPVVNDDNVICGVVTADGVLAEVMPQHWGRHRIAPNTVKRQKTVPQKKPQNGTTKTA